jgi:hypothetical protein
MSQVYCNGGHYDVLVRPKLLATKAINACGRAQNCFALLLQPISAVSGDLQIGTNAQSAGGLIILIAAS